MAFNYQQPAIHFQNQAVFNFFFLSSGVIEVYLTIRRRFL